MNCTLEYERGNWICSCTDLSLLLQANPDPNEYIVNAIQAFHGRYYPDDPPQAASYPWQMHRPEKLDQIKAKIDRHELTWHWRLLLPCLRDSYLEEMDSHSIVLCVSQIRQWQLVSCFRMKWPAEDADLTRNIRKAPKDLLRPPVFGRSNRITRWEVYAALYEECVKSQIIEAVTAAGTDQFRLAHVLGRHDSYFKVSDIKPASGRYELRIQHIIDLEPEQAPIRLEEYKIDNPCRPYGLACVPTFKESKEKELPKPEELLFSSDNYCRAFEQISDVLNDPGARSVLVIAPPGSGKEGLSSLLHRCRRRQGRLVVTSLAGLDEEAAAFQLFTLDMQRHRDGIEEKPRWWQPKADFNAELGDGALFKALRGTLVIDELDKASDPVRSMLLRFLESDEVTVPKTSVVLRIPPELRPLCVFAGSKTRKEFLQMGPIDFWSRITHIVEMQHPLAVGESSERLRIAEDYLRLFWLHYVKEYFERESLLGSNTDQLYKPLRDKFAEWWKLFADKSMGDFVSRELAEVLCGPSQPLPSVRTLRGTAGRCFNLLFHALLYHKRNDAPLELWRQLTAKDPPLELQELVRAATSRAPNGDDLSFTAFRALDEIQDLVRASASIQV